jgi:competence CoiA-like predicted nuclease
LGVLLNEKFIDAASHFNVVEYYFLSTAFNWMTSVQIKNFACRNDIQEFFDKWKMNMEAKRRIIIQKVMNKKFISAKQYEDYPKRIISSWSKMHSSDIMYILMFIYFL